MKKKLLIIFLSFSFIEAVNAQSGLVGCYPLDNNANDYNSPYIATIGSRHWTYFQNFVGDIEDVRIYNRVLSQTEIQNMDSSCQQSKSISISDGLIAYYPFCGNANDMSGNNNHLTAMNGVSLTSDRFGNANSAYGFDGINDFLVSSNAFYSSATNHTLSIWFKISDSTKSYQSLYDTEPHRIEEVEYNWDSHGIFELFLGDGSDWTIASNHDLNLNFQKLNWNHLVVRNTGLLWEFFLNGGLAHSYTAIGLPSSQLAKLWIGSISFYGLSNPDELFKGQIDDIRIYNRALTNLEVETLFHESDCSCASLTPLVTIASTPLGSICTGTPVTFIALTATKATPSPPCSDCAGAVTAITWDGITYFNPGFASQVPGYPWTAYKSTPAESCTGGTNTGRIYKWNSLTCTWDFYGIGGCDGNDVYFGGGTPNINACDTVTTTTNPGGGTVNYNFKVNGTSVQNSASNTFTTTTLTNADTVTCEITITGGTCLATNKATSNPITLTMNEHVPSVILATNSTTICTGQSVTFTATTTATTTSCAPPCSDCAGAVTAVTWDGIIYSSVSGNPFTAYKSTPAEICTGGANTARIYKWNSLTCAWDFYGIGDCSATDVYFAYGIPNTNACCTTTTTTYTGGGTVNYNFKVNGTSVQNSASNTFTTTTLTNADKVTCEITITGGTCLTTNTAISNPITMTENAALNLQVYPNPANQNTLITFHLCESVRISLDVFNVLGQQITILEDRVLNSGNQSFTLNTNRLAAGVYFVRLQTIKYQTAKKLVVIH